MKWVLACLLLSHITISFQALSLVDREDIRSFQIETSIPFSYFFGGNVLVTYYTSFFRILL